MIFQRANNPETPPWPPIQKPFNKAETQEAATELNDFLRKQEQGGVDAVMPHMVDALARENRSRQVEELGVLAEKLGLKASFLDDEEKAVVDSLKPAETPTPPPQTVGGPDVEEEWRTTHHDETTIGKVVEGPKPGPTPPASKPELK